MKAAGITLIDALLLLAVTILVAAVVMPQAKVRRIVQIENGIIAVLADLDTHLEDHRARAATDADADGRGEYPALGAVIDGTPLAERFSRIEGTDVWVRAGYYFAVLVPDREKRPVAASAPEAHTDYAEIAKLLVAWPVEPGVTGMRAYARWPGGVLLQHSIDGYPYTRDPPAPDAPLVTVEGGAPRRADRYPGGDWAPPVFAGPRRVPK